MVLTASMQWEMLIYNEKQGFALKRDIHPIVVVRHKEPPIPLFSEHRAIRFPPIVVRVQRWRNAGGIDYSSCTIVAVEKYKKKCRDKENATPSNRQIISRKDSTQTKRKGFLNKGCSR